MANRVKGEVGFDVDGEAHTLVFDFNALCELEEEFGIDASKLGDVMGGSMTNLRKVFRVGLSRNHDVNDAQAGDIISAIGPARAGELIGEAFKAAFPEPEPARGRSGRPQKAARAGTT